MDLLTFISDMTRRKLLADALNKSPDYLWQIGKGWNKRKASPKLAIEIEQATAAIGPETVSRQELRPDVFGPPVVAEAGVADGAQAGEAA